MGDGTTVELDVEVAVVGAGLAGLAAATVAARAGASVVVYDVRCAGGRARSDERDGFIFNQGPHALYRAGAGVGVLDRLGVRFEGSLPHPVAAGYREATGELGVLPSSPASLLRSPLVGIGDKVRLGRLLGRLPKLEAAPLARLSAAEWIETLGLTSNGAAVLSALTRVATYTSDLRFVSADAAVGQLQLAIEGNVLYLDGGWQTLVDGLVAAASAAGVRLFEGERVTAVQAGKQGTWDVSTPTVTVRAGSVVIAAGGPAAARAMLSGAPDWGLGAAATATCLDLGLSSLPATRVAYGLDEPLYFSTHSPNARLAHSGGAVVHVMRYGARTSEEDRAELWTLARRCGVGDDEVVTERFLHQMTVCHALPRPGAGLAGRPATDATGSFGVFLAGDWVGPVGLLADGALASGEAAGRAAAKRAMSVRAPIGAMVER
ncbi:MAG: FAD-dependent oxidoreductase [Actinomycetota bacterium]|nr:FAD-dependent oxidoreductase [Actinomycetota bacterium]